MTIDEVQDDLIEQFAGVDDWMDKYQLLIDLGNDLPPLDECYKKPQYLIEGCQSRVWIQASFDETTRRVHFRAESDTIIVKGLVSLLLEVLNDRTPGEILGADLYFIERIGLKEHLSPTRSNGLAAMVKQLYDYALVFHNK